MNTMPQVKIGSQNNFAPHHTREPFHRAIRWVPIEESFENCQPLLDVFLTQKAYVRICAHAGSDLDNEVGGWLAGRYCRDTLHGNLFIIIDTALPAIYTEQDAVHLTFTGDSQVALHNHLETYFPNKVILGWYHTHPRMGVFLSHWDAWLHQNFFSEPWQVALVVEPHKSTGGFFIRQQDGSLDQRSYFGFYELTNHSQRSVVFWRNLRSVPEADNEIEEDAFI